MRHTLITLFLVTMGGCGTQSENQLATHEADDSSGVNIIGMRFVTISPGKFTMGDPVGHSDEVPHEVTLTKSFEMGLFEVTQDQYERVMGTNPSKFKGPQNPVNVVSWHDAVEFCRKLSAVPAEKAAGYVYRLPTEAEWEYACRAGTTTTYCFGDNDAQLGEYAWYGKNSDLKPHPVGEKKPNRWGLYDMHGNVWEWCQDWHNNYPSGAVTDPTSSGSPHGTRVLRGGDWHPFDPDCRSASRHGHGPGYSSSLVGFRVVRSSVK